MLGTTSPLIRIGATERPLGKKQRRFNTLVKRIARIRQALAAWTQAIALVREGAAEHERLERDHLVAISDLIRLLDRCYDHRALTKTQRPRLRSALRGLALDALDRGGPDDLKAIYARHAERDYDEELARAEQAEAAHMRAIVEQQFGVRVDDVTASPDDLRRVIEEELQRRHEAAEQRFHEAEERKARRKKSARELAAEARRETERIRVDKALQDVYRQLAKALHPDREPDAGERERKTRLMQQVNVAYEAKDLLRLLDLQLRIEQVDQVDLDSIADERLDHFNRLLAEQVKQLEDELEDVEQPWRFQLRVPPWQKLAAKDVLAQLQQDLRALSRTTEMVRRDIAAFADIRAVKHWLNSHR